MPARSVGPTCKIASIGAGPAKYPNLLHDWHLFDGGR